MNPMPPADRPFRRSPAVSRPHVSVSHGTRCNRAFVEPPAGLLWIILFLPSRTPSENIKTSPTMITAAANSVRIGTYKKNPPIPARSRRPTEQNRYLSIIAAQVQLPNQRSSATFRSAGLITVRDFASVGRPSLA